MVEEGFIVGEDQSAFRFMGEVPIVGPRYRVGVVGATGAVGGTMLKVLRERAFPIGELRLFASPASRGKWIETPYGPLMVEQLAKKRLPELDFIFMAAGKEAAKAWAWKLARRGAIVIDKSPYFRNRDYAPLLTPEVNADDLDGFRGIVANPNCTTIPLVLALNPLHRKYGLRQVTAVTLQSVSGAGKRGLAALESELLDDEREPSAFPYRIAYNVIPWIGGKSGAQSGEEKKMVDETRRILHLPRLSIKTTCIRVPTRISHAIAVHAEFRRRVPVEEARRLIAEGPGLKLLDSPSGGLYPTPLHATGKDHVFVGRVRRDRGPNCLAMFIASDNLRKGAALNAVQIAETILMRGLNPGSI